MYSFQTFLRSSCVDESSLLDTFSSFLQLAVHLDGHCFDLPLRLMLGSGHFWADDTQQ